MFLIFFWERTWVIERGSWDLTEDANSILTDNADRAIQSNVAYFGTNANIGINLFW